MAKLTGDALQKRINALNTGWRVVNDQRLEKEYDFDDFAGALAFVNAVGTEAESANHHPDVYLSWGKVKLTIWTHSEGGLTGSDFDLAAAADAAYEKRVASG